MDYRTEADSDFAPQFLFLQQEAYLVQSALAVGLTALRNASLSDKGAYYTGFFGLSIGTERLMKLVLILDTMARNQLKPPTRKELKDLGHDLLDLLESVRGLKGARAKLEHISTGAMEFSVLKFLSEFGKTARYFNLDALTTGEHLGDPLADWQLIMERLISENV